jgi:hypothetical protein
MIPVDILCVLSDIIIISAVSSVLFNGFCSLNWINGIILRKENISMNRKPIQTGMMKRNGLNDSCVSLLVLVIVLVIVARVPAVPAVVVGMAVFI